MNPVVSRPDFKLFFIIIVSIILAACDRQAEQKTEIGSLPSRIKIETVDKVKLKDANGKAILLINVHPYQSKLETLSSDNTKLLLLRTALHEGAVTLGYQKNVTNESIKVFLADVKDMNEYGIGKDSWTEIASMMVNVKDGSASLADVIYKKEKIKSPSMIASIPFPVDEEASVLLNKKKLRFWLPKKIFLVAGISTSIFYEALVTLKDPEDVRFLAEGSAMSFAKVNRRGMVFNPTNKNKGKHLLQIKVFDMDNQRVLKATSEIIVSSPITKIPSKAKRGIRILSVGHCNVESQWIAYLADRLLDKGNPKYNFVGSIKYKGGPISGAKNNPSLDKIHHEGSGQFDVFNLLSYYNPGKPVAVGIPDRSPFVYKEGDGPPKIDVSRYIREELKGLSPHFIFLNVGENNAWNFKPHPNTSEYSKYEDRFYKGMNTLVDNLKKAAPKAVIAIPLTYSYNIRDNAFKHSYKGKFPRWEQIQNRTRFIEIMRDLENKRNDIVLIPSNLSVDSIYDFPKDNAVHMAGSGSQHFAESIYAWLKFELNNNFKFK